MCQTHCCGERRRRTLFRHSLALQRGKLQYCTLPPLSIGWQHRVSRGGHLTLVLSSFFFDEENDGSSLLSATSATTTALSESNSPSFSPPQQQRLHQPFFPPRQLPGPPPLMVNNALLPLPLGRGGVVASVVYQIRGSVVRLSGRRKRFLSFLFHLSPILLQLSLSRCPVMINGRKSLSPLFSAGGGDWRGEICGHRSGEETCAKRRQRNFRSISLCRCLALQRFREGN